MENFNEGRTVYQPNIYHGTDNPPKIVDNYEECDSQAESYFEEYLRMNKRFSKIMRQLDKISRKNVPTNVKNFQQKEKDGKRKKLNFSYRWKGIQCFNCKNFGHIQAECSSVPREQRKILNIMKDEEGKHDQGNNGGYVKDLNTSDQSNSKKRCMALSHKLECSMSGNMPQHWVKHDYQFLKCVSLIPCTYIIFMVENFTIYSWILSGIRRFKRNINKFGLESLIPLLLLSPTRISLVKIGILKVVTLGS